MMEQLPEAYINYLGKNAINISLDVSTPVTSKTEQVKPLSINGITNNTSVILGLQKIWWGDNFSYDPKSYNDAIKAVGGDTHELYYIL